MVTHLEQTQFTDDEIYSITIEDDDWREWMGRPHNYGGVTVYSECCSATMSRKVAAKVYEALGLYLGYE